MCTGDCVDWTSELLLKALDEWIMAVPWEGSDVTWSWLGVNFDFWIQTTSAPSALFAAVFWRSQFQGTSLNQRRTEAGWCPRPSCIDERRIRRRVWSSDARCPYPPTWLSQCQGMPPPNMGLAWFLTHFLFGIFVDLSCLQFIKQLPILYLSFGCPHLVNSRDRCLHSPLYTPLC